MPTTNTTTNITTSKLLSQMVQQTGHGIHLSHSRGTENIPVCSNSNEGMGEIGDRQTLSKLYISEEIEPAVCRKIYKSAIDPENYTQDKTEQIQNSGNTRMYNSLEMSPYSPVELSCSENNLPNNNGNIDTSRNGELWCPTIKELHLNNNEPYHQTNNSTSQIISSN